MRGAHAVSILAFLIALVSFPSIAFAYNSDPMQTQHATMNGVGYSRIRSGDGCIALNNTLPPAKPQILRCSLFPSDDTFVDDLSPTKSFGDLPVLIVQDAPSIPKYRNYAYLKFSLPSSLPPDIISTRANPDNASLRMYVRLMGLSYNASIRVYRVPSNDWNESSLTWITRPPYDPSDYSVRQVTANGTWFGWDITRPVGLAIGEQGSVSLAVVPSSNDWRNFAWFDSTRQVETDITTWPTLDLVFKEPFLTVLTQHPNLQIRIGNQTYETDSNGRFGTYLPWGNYKISVPEIIPKGEGVRSSFVEWSDNVTQASRVIALGNNLTLNVNYETQYNLDASSPYATINGSGWYDENAIAHIAVYPTTVAANGILGLIGIRHVFNHWSGDCSLAQADCTMIINGPKRVIAVWRDDYTITIVATVGLISAAAIVTMFQSKHRKVSRRHLTRSKRA